jgi:hypothetical protein
MVLNCVCVCVCVEGGGNACVWVGEWSVAKSCLRCVPWGFQKIRYSLGLSFAAHGEMNGYQSSKAQSQTVINTLMPRT